MKADLRLRMEEIRARTLCLLHHVPDEFFNRRVHSFYSPVGWHFGHIGRTEEYWVCTAALGLEPCDEALDFLYTDRPDNPKDNRVSVPSKQATIAYLARTRERTLDLLETSELRDNEPFLRQGYAWEFALQHECQHQETICEMLQLIHLAIGKKEFTPVPWQSNRVAQFVDVPSGTFLMGSSHIQAYDNEQAPVERTVEPFRLASCQTSVYEWSRYMEEGGYLRRELWSAEGWSWRESEGIERPYFWIGEQKAWGTIGMMGPRALHPDEPVCSISKFEAEAYARWAGARLPTETEWEYAASRSMPIGPNGRVRIRFPWGGEPPNSRKARFAMNGWSPDLVGNAPEGRSIDGVHDLAGNVWEWTSSPFLPYPGFRPFPYPGYSEDHMDGKHFCCRGGSWATAAPILRSTFRNWYVPSYRQGLLGVRLAQ